MREDGRNDQLAWLAVAGCVAVLLAGGGCATTAMKGTPFFTGEVTPQSGTAADRVNLWPLIYYRDPALSVLWPIGEFSDQHLAIRPLLSIDGLNEEAQTVGVLWPLSQFNERTHQNWIFPFFWGQDYLVGFPLYWHFDEPFGAPARGSDSLWPLWCYFRDGEQFSLHLVWPFFNVKDYETERGWRLWPIFGRYEDPTRARGHGYALWPLAGHQWKGGDASWTLLPLFHRSQNGSDTDFFSLLGGWSHDGEEDATNWYLWPLLSWGQHARDVSSTTLLLGLGHASQAADVSTRWLFPIGYEREAGQDRLLLTPLYASGQSASETWRMVIPLYYYANDAEGARLITPLYAGWTNASGGKARWFPPLLSGYLANTQRWDCWALLGLGHFSGGPEAESCHLFPLFYRDAHADSFVSLLYAAWSDGNSRLHALPLLLSGWSAGEDGEREIFGLLGIFHAHWGESLPSSSGHLLPLYYFDDEHLLTPLVGWWQTPGVTNRYFATPLFGVRSGRETGSWLFPLYSHTRDAQIDTVRGSFLLLGDYRSTPRALKSGFPLLYQFHRWRITPEAAAKPPQWDDRDGWQCNLLLIGQGANYLRRGYPFPPDRIFGAAAPLAISGANLVEVRHQQWRLFPLWNCVTDDSVTGSWRRASGNLLWCLYDYRREIGVGATNAAPHDYTRRRVLFRLVHHERLNGAVSTDIFPAITYDRDPVADQGGFSILWRLFRYRYEGDGKDIDLLFLPVWRSRHERSTPDAPKF